MPTQKKFWRLPSTWRVTRFVLLFAAILAAGGEEIGVGVCALYQLERVVIADEQTAGRGRRGRTWFSPPASGLYVSIVLAPVGAHGDPERAAFLVVHAVEGVVDGLLVEAPGSLGDPAIAEEIAAMVIRFVGVAR